MFEKCWQQAMQSIKVAVGFHRAQGWPVYWHVQQCALPLLMPLPLPPGALSQQVQQGGLQQAQQAALLPFQVSVCVQVGFVLTESRGESAARHAVAALLLHKLAQHVACPCSVAVISATPAGRQAGRLAGKQADKQPGGRVGGRAGRRAG